MTAAVVTSNTRGPRFARFRTAGPEQESDLLGGLLAPAQGAADGGYALLRAA